MAAIANRSMEAVEVTPPPPVPLPPAVSLMNRAVRLPRLPFSFLRFHLSRRTGGVAAIRRSRRSLWLLALLVLAVLLGFVFVRFFLGPAVPHATHLPVARLKGMPWRA
jgi:hypothetical protein